MLTSKTISADNISQRFSWKKGYSVRRGGPRDSRREERVASLREKEEEDGRESHALKSTAK